MSDIPPVSHGPTYMPTVLPYTKSKTDVRGEAWEIAQLAHIHTEDGLCYKDRYGTCLAPKFRDEKLKKVANFYEGYPAVEFYEEGSHITRVSFKKKWQAFLFHTLLNKSVFHAGVRDY